MFSSAPHHILSSLYPTATTLWTATTFGRKSLPETALFPTARNLEEKIENRQDNLDREINIA
jgi:hypothetical protein